MAKKTKSKRQSIKKRKSRTKRSRSRSRSRTSSRRPCKYGRRWDGFCNDKPRSYSPSPIRRAVILPYQTSSIFSRRDPRVPIGAPRRCDWGTENFCKANGCRWNKDGNYCQIP